MVDWESLKNTQRLEYAAFLFSGAHHVMKCHNLGSCVQELLRLDWGWRSDHPNASVPTSLHSATMQLHLILEFRGLKGIASQENKTKKTFSAPSILRHKLFLEGGFVLQMCSLPGKNKDGQLHKDFCFNLVFLFLLPFRQSHCAHAALGYCMLYLRLIDKQSAGLSCEAVWPFNMYNDQQQLSQSAARLTE